jgi:UDP-2-acetamido-2,6-beta-L-arabino-hexul-4-ose reductase
MNLSNRRILVTGADGFIGKNLMVRLKELSGATVTPFLRTDNADLLPQLVHKVDAVVHLAGENRPSAEASFWHVNLGLTATICDALKKSFHSTGRHVCFILASSTQAEFDTPYGASKLAAERVLQTLSVETGNPCIVFRFPGVFGKWCKPNYNSVVATFCHNIANDLPINIYDTSASLKLVYVDDVVSALLTALDSPKSGYVQCRVEPEYTITLGELANQIRTFAECRSELITERVGVGFLRALHATYMSYLPSEKFTYQVKNHTDFRGVFVEMIKTSDSGQVSFFTAKPGVTRGGHYHHTKTEKFLVVKGEALFRCRHLLTNDLVEIRACGTISKIIESIPGWVHDITNVGDDELIVMLWASENFNIESPDTIASKI